jgi:hypothetical protein
VNNERLIADADEKTTGSRQLTADNRQQITNQQTSRQQTADKGNRQTADRNGDNRQQALEANGQQTGADYRQWCNGPLIQRSMEQ